MKTQINKQQFGPWALITGASSGIGESFAENLASQGFDLVLTARRKQKLEELGVKLQEKYKIQCKIIQADFSKPESIPMLIRAVSALDIGLFISNAGAARPGKFVQQSMESILELVQLNALTHLHLTKHFAQKMAQKRKGGIILVGAMGAAEGIPYMAIEAGTKSMVEALGKSLNTELKEHGIHLTVLIPSPTDTPALDYLGFRNGTMPAKPVPVQQCVEESLAALRQNKATIIPGKKYRIMHSIVPEKSSRKMMGEIIKKNNHI